LDGQSDEKIQCVSAGGILSSHHDFATRLRLLVSPRRRPPIQEQAARCSFWIWPRLAGEASPIGEDNRSTKTLSQEEKNNGKFQSRRVLDR
jgi:hypothetical protein